MPENNGEIMVERNPDGTIKSGCLNPKGKPKGARSLTTLLREALIRVGNDKGERFDELLIKKVLDKALVEGDNKMIELAFNYIDGKPLQTVVNKNNHSFKKTIDEVRDELKKEAAGQVHKDSGQATECVAPDTEQCTEPLPSTQGEEKPNPQS